MAHQLREVACRKARRSFPVYDPFRMSARLLSAEACEICFRGQSFPVRESQGFTMPCNAAMRFGATLPGRAWLREKCGTIPPEDTVCC